MPKAPPPVPDLRRRGDDVGPRRPRAPAVLIGDDDPVCRAMLAATLGRRGYRVRLATDGEQVLDELERDPSLRLLLLDWELPRIDGPTVCRRIRERRDPRYVYVILVASRTSDSDLIDGLAAGADDYVTKPWTNSVLEARLEVGQRTCALHQSLVESRDDAQMQALRDPLTGLPNRRALFEVLDRHIGARACDEATSLILLDIDHFKQVNDRFGHHTGDAVLLEVAGRLSAAVRPDDLVGRHGGEEFMVVAPGADALQGFAVAERVRQADVALYEAKGSGRNRTCAAAAW